MNITNKLSEIGRKVDPYLEKYLTIDLSDEFKEVVLHQVKTGGKRVRPALVILSCEACGGKEEDALPIAAAIELIHNYSLIFDDIIDHGEFRRGKPTTRKLYGDVMAMLAGLHYREAITEAINDSKNSHELHKIIAKTIKDLIEGERLDVLFEQAGRENESYIIKHRRSKVTLEEYLRMIRLKTASLIKTSCVVGGIVANAPDEYIKALEVYGEGIGIAFQIRDDILDIFAEEKKFGKKVGKDIIEHKLGNIVILYALEELDTDSREKLLSILRKDKVTDDDVRVAINIISKTKAKEKAYELGKSYVEKAITALDKLPQSKAKEYLIALAKFIIERSY